MHNVASEISTEQAVQLLLEGELIKEQSIAGFNVQHVSHDGKVVMLMQGMCEAWLLVEVAA